MDGEKLFLLEALVAVLPYAVVKSGEWLNVRRHRFSLRRTGAGSHRHAPN